MILQYTHSYISGMRNAPVGGKAQSMYKVDLLIIDFLV